MNTVLISVAILVGLWLMGMPLLIYFTFRAQARPTLTIVRDEIDLPLEVVSYFETVGDELEALGFTAVETMFLPQLLDNVKAVLKLYLHPQQQDLAMAVVAYALVGEQWKLNSKYVEFSTRAADGRTFNLRNSRVVGAFPIAKKVSSLIYRRDHPVERIYRAHQTVLRAHAVTTKVVRLHEEFHGDAPALISAGMTEEFETARELGYLRYANDSQDENQTREQNPYRPTGPASTPAYVTTLRGAYMVTWNELWPIKPLNLRRHIWRSDRVMREAGVNLT